MNFGITDRSYDLILKTLLKYEKIEKATIFGSRAMGNYKKGSDIDLCIHGSGLNDDIVRKLNLELNEILDIPYLIDIIHYESVENEKLKEHIDTEGQVIINR